MDRKAANISACRTVSRLVKKVIRLFLESSGSQSQGVAGLVFFRTQNDLRMVQNCESALGSN